MKKYLSRIFMLLFSAVLALTFFAGCNNTDANEEDAAADTASSAELIAAISEAYPAGSTMELSYAKNFSIEYLDDAMKLVTDGQGNQILLLQEGQTAPEKYADLTSLTIPITKVVYTSTTQVGYLRAFDDDSLFDSIVGVRATADTWDFDAMKSRMESGQIVDVGSNTSMSTSYDYEIMRSLLPGVVFTNAGMGTEQTDLMSMLDEAGIPYVFDGSSAETDYRGMMEWVKFFGAFYNRELTAESYFDDAMAKIDDVIAVTSEIPDHEKVKVGWGIVTGGKIYVENAGSSSAQMVRDCGGAYVFDDIGAGVDGVTELTAEEFYKRLSDADIFINRGMPSYGPDIDSIVEQFPVLANLGCMQEGKVLQITDNYWNSYHNIDGKYMEMAEFFYADKFNTITVDDFSHFLVMPQTVE